MTNFFPFYYQTLETDCGPTCLKMIAEFYSREFNVEPMINNQRIKIRGASLLDICNAAEKIGLIPKAFQAKAGFLKRIELPAILYWNQSHFIVLFAIEQNRFHIADPQNGLRIISKAELKRNWEWIPNGKNQEGVALTFSIGLDAMSKTRSKITDL